ncbi:MAG: hypothetical protein JW837_15070 [Sedimentisphaerales bacterium]|nr:hypothetical protein [Sedimentisphaerales bacterium]
MSTKHFIITILFSLSISCPALADRQLERAEILEIFEKLTSRSETTWISTGILEAKHEEYRAPKTTNTAEINSEISEQIREYQNNPSKRELTIELQKMKLDAIPFNVRYRQSNTYTMNSTVILRYDGDRFYWEIDVSSRTDSVRPDASLEGNYMTEEFNLNYNKRRIFAWDGQKYTHYFLPGNHAVVDTTGTLPQAVNGPLTAGYIPWGHGDYTYAKLSAAELSAEEKSVNGQTRIEITIDNSDGSVMEFVTDPKKDYAVISSSIDDLDTVVSSIYSDYQMVSGRWVPSDISIERFDSGTDRLLSYDIWSFTRISGETPPSWSFNVDFEADASIEYRSLLSNQSAMYNYSYVVDTEQLLLDRLAYAATEGTQLQNCATAALKYTMRQSGKEVTDQQLAQLVSRQDKTTSLYKMKKFVERQGLYCRAVKLDINSLGNLQGCEAILHLPEKNHFIVLGEVDDRYIGSIDLSSKRFYYRTDISFFGMKWTDGTALLISNRPINLQGSFTEISNSGLNNISGGNGWQCIDKIQESDTVYCDTSCVGYYQYYPERWGCKYVGSGYCAHSSHLRKEETPCIVNPYGDGCTGTGDWTEYYMWACD